MIERASVDVDAIHALAPGEANRLGEQPTTMALAGKLGDEADEGELAHGGPYHRASPIRIFGNGVIGWESR